MVKGKMLAMLLAGGQGSRLKQLTQKMAKPAVYFGGKYRIIDFALSNCANSNIKDVGVLTQYQPFALNTHIGIGVPWDLDRRIGGVELLPPHMTTEGGRWYAGTANAIYENIDYVDLIDPEFVLILSGDHIYKMDYSKMLDHHMDTKADVTISVIEVPWEEAGRFGILNTHEDGTIYEFEEKPEKPKSNLASMGIYIFKWDLLKSKLIEDHSRKNTDHDFGKDIIPSILKDGGKLVAYKFDGYWKDVGTIESYWQANMDLLDRQHTLDLYDDKWKIYTRNYDVPPQYVAKTGDVDNTLLNEGCKIYGKVKNSVVFTGAIVEDGAVVEDSILLPYCRVSKDAIVNKAIIMGNSIVDENEKVNLEGNKIELYGKEDQGVY